MNRNQKRFTVQSIVVQIPGRASRERQQTGIIPSITQPPPRPEMTTADPAGKRADDRTGFDHLARNTNAYRLAHHLGRSESTIVQG